MVFQRCALLQSASNKKARRIAWGALGPWGWGRRLVNRVQLLFHSVICCETKALRPLSLPTAVSIAVYCAR